MSMTMSEYQAAAMRTSQRHQHQFERLANGALGLAGEAGEVCDDLKKHLFHGHALEREDLLRELGDVLWYITLLADAVCCSLDDVAKANIDKLKARYPEGFDTERSQNR